MDTDTETSPRQIIEQHEALVDRILTNRRNLWHLSRTRLYAKAFLSVAVWPSVMLAAIGFTVWMAATGEPVALLLTIPVVLTLGIYMSDEWWDWTEHLRLARLPVRDRALQMYDHSIAFQTGAFPHQHSTR